MKYDTALVAIGGNAILRADERGTAEEQIRNIGVVVQYVGAMLSQGYKVVLTHGNGPQVGNILLQNELGKKAVPPMSLDVCVAESQGLIGYLLQQQFQSFFLRQGMDTEAVSLITQVVVSRGDPAFQNPTKPIGPYYTKEDAEALMKEKGWKMIEDVARGGYRRVVPSPQPLRIVEADTIRKLRAEGKVVIAAGGGGVPVVEREGRYEGVEAVVDKDLASSVLARDIEERLFIILTDVPCAYLNFGSKSEQGIGKVSADKMKEYYEDGHFPPGSMGPKIEAALNFLENGGERTIITSPELLAEALEERAGTHIVQ